MKSTTITFIPYSSNQYHFQNCFLKSYLWIDKKSVTLYDYAFENHKKPKSKRIYIFCVFMVRFKELKDGIVTYRKNSIIIST